MNARRSLFDLNDLFVEAIDAFFEFGDEFLVEFEDKEGRLHVFPGDVKVDALDRHVLVQGHHVRALVVVRPSEQRSQELHHRRVQLRDVAYVLQEEIVDSLVSQHELVELSYHFLQLIVPSDLLE